MGTVTVGLTVIGMVASTAVAEADGPVRQSPLTRVSGSKAPSLAEGAPSRQLDTSTATVPVTLVTGDRVDVGRDADGKPVVRGFTSKPRPDGAQVTFHTITRDGSVYVVPNDALSLVDQGMLDWGLFDIDRLVGLGARSKAGSVPVLVTYDGKAATARSRRVAGTTGGRTLTSINGRSMTIVDGGTWWQGVRGKGASGPAAARSAGSLAGVEKVWLNGVAKINLDTSVPQIGATVAWAKGYDGTGVSVAVLDTGIDPGHPDVAGKIAEQVDFSGSADGPKDGHGHGTHVASAILGTGSASKGLRKGVAPGALLRVGKVCDDKGQCPDDAVIAGMEWAAHSGAKAVNMSIGDVPTDGTDPLSQALNELSRSTGTLFVVAAGNSGPRPGTVESPGAADEALTVAAVDKQDKMAGFSSRGPRVGDGAPKPDIAAPGVDIVAARAAGTAMGTVVDDYYTTASGTSMATPHVAGASAIVAQQHPDLTGREIKALLMSTASDVGHTAAEQGVGRVNVGAATDPRITTGGSLGFGRLTFPHAPLTKKVTYTNHTDEAVTLSLEASLSSGGKPARAGLFTLGSDHVVVPANGSADVPLTLDGRVLGKDGTYGNYSGLLNARDAAGVLRMTTPVGAFLEPEKFPLTVKVIPPKGATDVTYGIAAFIRVDDDGILLDTGNRAVEGGESFALSFFSGTYSGTLPVSWRDSAGELQTAQPLLTEVKITEATGVTLDLRKVQPLRTDFPEYTEAFSSLNVVQRVSARGTRTLATTTQADYNDRANWWSLPSARAKVGTLTHELENVRTTPVVTMRATGGGDSFPLDARYLTPSSSPIASQMWLQDGRAGYRDYSVPLERLPLKGHIPVVYAGTGSAAEVARYDVRGKLVLMIPSDICANTCDFPKFRDERVAVAAAAGAVGVLIAAPDLSSVGGFEESTLCADGPQSCPAVEPYAPLPIVKVPYADATRLITRIKNARSHVRIELGGSATPRVYAARHSTEGSVPSDLPFRVGKQDLDRVDQSFHSDRQGEVTKLYWWQMSPTGTGYGAAMPHPATQRVMTTFIQREPDSINRFQAAWADHGEGTALVKASGEYRDLVLAKKNAVHWNAGPAVPGAVSRVRTTSGFSVLPGGPCSGCRQGDTFYPAFQLTGSGGGRQAQAGFLNNDGFVEILFSAAGCGPSVSTTIPTFASVCDFRLRDRSGVELERRTQRFEMDLTDLGGVL